MPCRPAFIRISSQHAVAETPGKGSGILDTEIHAAGAKRRVDMRRIAAEEDAGGLVA